MILGKKEAFQDYKNICLWKTQNKNFFIGVTGGYKGLQGLTGGYNGVTKDFRNFFLGRTFPNTLSWSILHKNKSWRNLKLWTKRMDQPLWKNSYFAFFINRCSCSSERLLFYLERQQTLFLYLFFINTKHEKTSTFLPKSWTIPFGKSQFCVLFKSMFVLFRKACNENVTKYFFSMYFA